MQIGFLSNCNRTHTQTVQAKPPGKAEKFPLKDNISTRNSFPSRALIVPLLDWLPARVADDFCCPEDPDAIGDHSSFFAVTQQQWRAGVRRMLRCKLACALPPSALDPRLAAGAFAVAKDENRERFTGDRRPEQSGKKCRARAPALLPASPTNDSWQIRNGASHDLKYQRLFQPARSSSVTCNETGDRSSRPPNLARTS